MNADNSYEGIKKRNLSKELDRLIGCISAEDIVPKLLLHSCCAPCSSYVIEYLSQYFAITVFIIIPIYPSGKNTRNVLRSRSVLSVSFRRRTK